MAVTRETLRARAVRRLADQRAFARPASRGEANDRGYAPPVCEQGGMTYREWLVGQVLSCQLPPEGANPRAYAQFLISVVDAVIDALVPPAPAFDPDAGD